MVTKTWIATLPSVAREDVQDDEGFNIAALAKSSPKGNRTPGITPSGHEGNGRGHHIHLRGMKANDEYRTPA